MIVLILTILFICIGLGRFLHIEKLDNGKTLVAFKYDVKEAEKRVEKEKAHEIARLEYNQKREAAKKVVVQTALDTTAQKRILLIHRRKPWE